jgi:glycosyltransferase involved in cell wall biosynthesis
MVKVCHILDNLNVGGLEKIAIDIILSLNGYEHQMWCLKEKGAMAGILEAKGIPVRELNFEGGLSVASVSRLVRELKKERFSIIHCHGLFPSVWARVGAVFAGVPIRIVHCHSTYYGLYLKERIRLKVLSFFTTAIIVVSNAVKKSLVEYIGIRGSKIKVIYNGIDDILHDKALNREKARAQLGLNPDDFVIGCIGRLVDMKGHSYLLDAIGSVRTRHPGCKCLIIGDGPGYNDILRQVSKLGLEDAVLMLGMRSDIPDLLSALDLVVSPSILKEGLPLALIEGAAMALPLVATNIGGSSEVVQDRINGFIVEPRDAGALADRIGYLIEHADDRCSMGKRSREIWQTRFRKDEMIRKIEQIYRDALNKAKLAQ